MKIKEFANFSISKIFEFSLPDCHFDTHNFKCLKIEDGGIYKYLYYNTVSPFSENVDGIYGKNLFFEIVGVDDGVCVLLYFSKGYLEMVEIFSHSGDSIPENINVIGVRNL